MHKAYVVNKSSSRLVPVQLPGGTHGTSISVGTTPVGVALTAHGSVAWVVRSGGVLAQVYPVIGIVVSTTTVGGTPVAVAVTPDNTTVYVLMRTGNIVPVDHVHTNAVGSAFRAGPTGTTYTGMAITPDGRWAYVIKGSSVIQVDLQLRTYRTVVSSLGTSGGPAIAISPDGTMAYVTRKVTGTTGKGYLYPLVLSSGVLRPALRFTGTPWAVGISADGSTAYVLAATVANLISVTLSTGTATTIGAQGSGSVGIAVTSIPDVPTADFTASTGGLVAVFLAPSAPGQAITSWSWTFGDGGTSTVQNPIHTYLQPGTYTVSLRVTNARTATATSSQAITVYRRVVLSPPRAWQFVAADTAGTPVGELTKATSRQVSWSVNDVSTASFGINGSHPEASLVEELASDLLIYRASDTGAKVLRFRGRIGASSDTGSPAGLATSFSASDYRGMLSVRQVWTGSTTTFATIDEADLAWTLISQSEARAAGAFGIQRGTAPTTGIVRSQQCKVGTSIATLIDNLATATPGFEWEIDPTLRFNLWAPERGTDGRQVLDYGGTVASFRRTVDPSNFRNALRYVGANTLTPVLLQALSFGAVGRWETQVTDSSITNQELLAAKAQAAFAQAQTVRPTWTLVLTPRWWTPDLLWLGDSVRVVIRYGRLAVNTILRVTKITVTIGDDGGETVTITAGPVLRDLVKSVQWALQRISALEHH
ncbi:MAG TPA: PKD domain-containing protein [Acidimicrobiales bacterium]|nr:PKD domain-containing protein [Acidimicrobiales bacterium]